MMHDTDISLLSLCSCSAPPASSPYPTVTSATLRQTPSKRFLHPSARSLPHHQPPPSTSSTATSGSCVSNWKASPASLRHWGGTFGLFWWHHCTQYWRRPERRRCWWARRRWALCGTSVRPAGTPPWRSWSLRTATTCSTTSHWTCRGSASIHR